MEKTVPVPQGKYIPAVRFGSLIFTAGMTPRKNGVLIRSGQVAAEDNLEQYREAVNQAAANVLAAARSMLEEGEEIRRALQLTVYVNGAQGFQKHSRLADFASEYLCGELGNAGIAARTALGAASLPGDAPVEIQLVCAVE